ncbi:MAG: MFS transporter, partial [Rhodospirillales bacterium]|nr:MFS transporter [Rhodospirillales bacterium]
MNLGLVRLVTLACTAYLLSQFYRSSVGVLAPDLMSRLSLTPEELGRLGGIFFLAFACAQLPLGVLLDRYGPRKTTSLVLVGAALGAFLFATFTEFSGLLAARALMGAGCSVGLMGSLVLFSRWVPSRRFGTMAGLVLGVGGFGGILATTPLAAASAWVGWEGVFIGMGAITLVVSMVY